jgi:exopolysaccharide biosynthesis protein
MQKNIALFALSICLFLTACGKKETPVNPVIPPTGGKDTTKVISSLITLPTGWVQSTSLSSGMPTTAGVFEYTAGAIKGFAFIYDLNDTTIEFSTTYNTARKTPSDWFASETGTRLAVMNAGYFDLTNGQSYSLIVNNGTQVTPNVKALTRALNGTNTSYYPTRAAFGLTNRVPSVNWIYNTSGTVNHAYPQPSPNVLNSPPQAVPSATFPAGGTIWQPTQAIGGSPMLIKNGAISISDAEELIVIDNAIGRSRTAIGYTANKRLILLVIEKSSTRSTSGVSLVEEAQILKDMGCTDAINLDGGGSTCLVVGNSGQTTNLPEGGVQRAVTSAIVIKKK